ncbi:MAG TPA: hypothetical protein VM491_15325, partial [Burkholderiaceae bacterium]|nr:hypothetical protein [Burkholderiaceae bacterium]
MIQSSAYEGSPESATGAWARAFAFGAVFAALAWLGVTQTSYEGRIAALWPANGLLLAALLASRPQAMAPLLASAFGFNGAVNLAAGDAISIAPA